MSAGGASTDHQQASLSNAQLESMGSTNWNGDRLCSTEDAATTVRANRGEAGFFNFVNPADLIICTDCVRRASAPHSRLPNRGKQAMAFSEHYTSTQASRVGRTSITFFVKEGAKPVIRAALADGGYGTSYQEGLVNMLNDLLESQNRTPLA